LKTMKAPLLFSLPIIFSMTIASTMQAQTLNGVYRMAGGHEMVAAFQFKSDHSFEFYFIYGAVDRHAKGTYEIKDNQILLHADKKPGHDFTVLKALHQGDGTTVQVTHPNTALLRHITAVFKKGNETDQQYSDETGRMHTAIVNCDTIYVAHTLFPDMPTLIYPTAGKNENYFELTMNPSLAELSFSGFVLQMNGEDLEGSLPWLFEREKAVFEKEAASGP